jgi:Nuclease-related domain
MLQGWGHRGDTHPPTPTDSSRFGGLVVKAEDAQESLVCREKAAPWRRPHVSRRGVHPGLWIEGFGTPLLSAAVALVMFVRDDPPQHVVNWRRGTDGERKTERALKTVEKAGFKVEHDLQRDGRANLDHVASGPRGIYLLETKNLTGTIRFQGGFLVASQFDDPDEIYRYQTLASRVRGQARDLSMRIGEKTGRRPWVNGVVVIWGYFPQQFIEDRQVAYTSMETDSQTGS